MILYENQKAQQRARTFEAQCHEQNGFDKPYDAFSAVSYTHLDVYKRQRWGL